MLYVNDNWIKKIKKIQVNKLHPDEFQNFNLIWSGF